MMELVKVVKGNIKLSVDVLGDVRASSDDKEMFIIKVEKGKVLEGILDEILNIGVEIDSEMLSTFCDEVENLFEENKLNYYPKVNTEEGTLTFHNNSIIFRKYGNYYLDKLISDINVDEDGNFSTTYTKLRLMKENIKISDGQYEEFTDKVKEFIRETREGEVIDINKDNYREYIEKVPSKVMIRFLNEYFNRR